MSKTAQTKPREFAYLLANADRKPGEAVDDVYQMKDLKTQPVVRNDKNNKYMVFESRKALWNYIYSLDKNQRCFHEVIFGWAPQRIKFDLDIPVHKLDAIPEGKFWDAVRGESPAEECETIVELRERKMRAFLQLLLDTIIERLIIAYHGVEDICPTTNDIAIADSNGQLKYSYHLIVLPYCVPNNKEVKEFVSQVIEQIPMPLKQFIDGQTNSRTQNFRLGGNTKHNAKRWKKVDDSLADEFGTAHAKPEEIMITGEEGARVLPSVYSTDEEEFMELPVPEESVQIVLSAIVKATKGHTFRNAVGSLLIFDRDTPTYCKICEETHHKDNTLLVSVEPTQQGEGDKVLHEIYEMCRHSKGNRRKLTEIICKPRIVEITANRSTRKNEEGRKSRVEAHVKSIQSGKIDIHRASRTEYETLPNSLKTIYSEPKMREYERVPTLAVKAQMKTGKTRALRSYLNKYYPINSIQKAVIRFVTFRQTFSAALTADDQFPDFMLYSKVQGNLDTERYPRLIVQVESLHRLVMETNPEPIDLLILDEVESIFSQFNSGLHRHFNAAFAMFRWLIRYSQFVICMDANLSDRTYHTLMKMRSDYPAHFHWNCYQRAAEDNYYFTGDQGIWLEKMFTRLEEGNKIVVATNSLTEAKSIAKTIGDDHPDKKIALYSSETPASEKQLHFGNVHEYWSKLDVLIYTPTVSAGISFEKEHFDCLFGYFSDMSCDTETARQMLQRVRNFSMNEYNICLRGTPKNLPVKTEDIRQLVYNKRAGLYRKIGDAALQFEYAQDGTLQYYESDYFHLWMETMRIENLSKNDYVQRFIDQVADTGATINLMQTDAKKAALTAIRQRQTNTKMEIKDEHCALVAEAEVLSYEDAQKIREDLSKQIDVSTENRLAYEKWLVCETYDWKKPVDGEFIKKYSNEDAKRIYRNLKRISEKESINATLNGIKDREAKHYGYLMNTRSLEKGYITEGKDLQRDKYTYVYQAHSLAIWLLRLCCFQCITDGSKSQLMVMNSRFRDALPSLEKSMPTLSYEFQLSRVSFQRIRAIADPCKFVMEILKIINAVLRKQYGIEIKRTPKTFKNDTTYHLQWTKIGNLFQYGAEIDPEDERPFILSKLKFPQDNDLSNFMILRHVRSCLADTAC